MAYRKWKNEFYVLVYRMARDGARDAAIAKACGITKVRFHAKKKTDEALRKALEDGRAKSDDFMEFVHGFLPKKLRSYWDLVVKAEKGSVEWEFAYGKLDELNTRMRQRFFLYALVKLNFNISKACKRSGVGITTYRKWCKETHFRELLDQIHQAKKDLFESSLIQLVKQGDTSAILFANRTMNRDRGYSDKVEVTVSGTVEHKVTIEELGLPLDTMLQIRDAVRKQEQKQIGYTGEEIEAEFEPAEEKEDA